MTSRLNWKIEEDRMLKHLRNEEKIQSWNQIAERLSSQFPDCQRTAKQCRQRFTNSSQFCDEAPQNRNWTIQQDRLLPELFLEHGSKWTFFMKYYPLRSENSIKNRFYGSIRKTVRKLKDFEQLAKSTCHSIKYEMIIRIFELAQKVERESQILVGKTPNQQLPLFKLRKAILDLSFGEPELSQEEIINLVKQLHQINILFRSLGIYKMKKKGEWELNKKRLQLIYNEPNPSSNSQSNELIVQVPKQEFEKTSTPFTQIPELEFEMINEIDLESDFAQPRDLTCSFEKQLCYILNEDFLPSFHDECLK